MARKELKELKNKELEILIQKGVELQEFDNMDEEAQNEILGVEANDNNEDLNIGLDLNDDEIDYEIDDETIAIFETRNYYVVKDFTEIIGKITKVTTEKSGDSWQINVSKPEKQLEQELLLLMAIRVKSEDVSIAEVTAENENLFNEEDANRILTPFYVTSSNNIRNAEEIKSVMTKLTANGEAITDDKILMLNRINRKNGTLRVDMLVYGASKAEKLALRASVNKKKTSDKRKAKFETKVKPHLLAASIGAKDFTAEGAKLSTEVVANVGTTAVNTAAEMVNTGFNTITNELHLNEIFSRPESVAARKKASNGIKRAGKGIWGAVTGIFGSAYDLGDEDDFCDLD